MSCKDARTMKRPFSDRLRQVVTHVGVDPESSTDIGRFLGISKQTVNEWLQGKEPSRRYALLISERCGVSLHWLITDEGDMIPVPVEDDLTPEERMLLRSYRKAGPDWKRAFLSLARGVGKAAVFLSVLLIYPPPADAGYLFSFSNWAVYYVAFLKRMLRRARIVQNRTFAMLISPHSKGGMTSGSFWRNCPLRRVDL